MTTRRPRRNPAHSGTPVAPETPATTAEKSAEPGHSAERLAYSVVEAALLTGVSRDLLYDEMRRGNLRYRKVGRRRLITRQHLEEFLGLVPRARMPADNIIGDINAAGKAP
jgi:excisionase family DNA binding protein